MDIPRCATFLYDDIFPISNICNLCEKIFHLFSNGIDRLSSALYILLSILYVLEIYAIVKSYIPYGVFHFWDF